MDLYLSSLGSFFCYHSSSDPVKRRPCSIAPSRSLLAYHFFSVAFYAIWIMFAYTRTIHSSQNGHSNGNPKSHSTTPHFNQYPALLIKSVRVVRQFHLTEYLSIFFLNLSFLVLDSLCSVRSVTLDGNTLVVGFKFAQVE